HVSIISILLASLSHASSRGRPSSQQPFASHLPQSLTSVSKLKHLPKSMRIPARPLSGRWTGDYDTRAPDSKHRLHRPHRLLACDFIPIQSPVTTQMRLPNHSRTSRSCGHFPTRRDRP
ncbi:hypothetical protein CEXT_226661, partial [Caerostris extrusa]